MVYQENYKDLELGFI